MRNALLALAAISSVVLTALPAEAQNTRRGPQVNIRPPSHQTQMEPRFIFQITRIEVLNETGFDDFGSDEIVLEYRVGERYAQGSYGMYTRVFENLDTDSAVDIPLHQSCVYPAVDTGGSNNGRWDCLRGGALGPVTFSITVWELDSLNPDITVSVGNWFVLREHCPVDIFPLIYDPCRFPDGDDEIGTVVLNYTMEDLLRGLPNPGMVFRETVTVEGYRLTIRITRFADVRAPAAPDRNVGVAQD